jgi:hypothetical protein
VLKGGKGTIGPGPVAHCVFVGSAHVTNSDIAPLKAGAPDRVPVTEVLNSPTGLAKFVLATTRAPRPSAAPVFVLWNEAAMLLRASAGS